MGLIFNTLDYLVRASAHDLNHGSSYGSKSTAEDVTGGLCLYHLTAIITGATSGIGAETARVLAKRGARVVIGARNMKAAIALKDLICEETPNARIIILTLDLSSFSSIRSFANSFLNLDLPLNILINNAGVFCKAFKKSQDDHELSFATNHLGHFLLTNLLLDRMVETAKDSGVEGRIVNVASCLHRWIGTQGINFININDKSSFIDSISYAQSKLANILHVKELGRRLKDINAHVTANAVHPGIVKTNIVRDHGGTLLGAIMRIASIFMKTIPQGAATICYVATHPQVEGLSGKYFVDCKEAQCSPCANNKKHAFELWKYSDKVTNQGIL